MLSWHSSPHSTAVAITIELKSSHLTRPSGISRLYNSRFMYGSVVPDPESREHNKWRGVQHITRNTSTVTRFPSVMGPDRMSSISWELILLLSAEFLTFGIVLLPLISDDEDAYLMNAFWKEYELVSIAACVPYICLTVPIAVGYHWFLKSTHINMLVWATIVASLAFVCHILSVITDPRGIFLGNCCLAGYMLVLAAASGVRMRCIQLDSGWLFLFALIWPPCVFLPVYSVGGLTVNSTIGSCIATVLCSIFLTSELRLVNKGVTLPSSYGNYIDPFTVAIWINCGTWRFLLQLLILIQKLFFHSIGLCFQWLGNAWRWTVSLFAQRAPTNWLTPPTLKRFAG
jgi:hypothetical protein